MAEFRGSLNSWQRGARLALFVTVFTVAGMGVAHAQTQNAPYSQFQYSTLTSSGNTITATRVPAVTAAGKTIYKDITLHFDVDSDGNLTLSSGYPQVFDSLTLLVSSFKAGSYVGPGSILNGKTPVFVDGPGALDGGATSWSISTATGADVCTYPSSATWYVGPIASNPLAARLKNAGITSTAWSYGVSGGKDAGSCSSNTYYHWGSGTLIGVSQTGNAITFASFTDTGSDKSAPVDQMTYRLAP